MDGGVMEKWEADASIAINRRDLSHGVSKAEDNRIEREERRLEKIASEYNDPRDLGW